MEASRRQQSFVFVASVFIFLLFFCFQCFLFLVLLLLTVHLINGCFTEATVVCFLVLLWITVHLINGLYRLSGREAAVVCFLLPVFYFLLPVFYQHVRCSIPRPTRRSKPNPIPFVHLQHHIVLHPSEDVFILVLALLKVHLINGLQKPAQLFFLQLSLSPSPLSVLCQVKWSSLISANGQWVLFTGNKIFLS